MQWQEIAKELYHESCVRAKARKYLFVEDVQTQNEAGYVMNEICDSRNFSSDARFKYDSIHYFRWLHSSN
jgi:hypothetical protein